MIRKTLFLFVLLIGCLAVFAQSNSFKENNVNIELPTGKLSLQPLNQNTVRVRFTKGQAVPKEELIYTEDVASPAYKVKENNTSLKLSLEKMIVVYDKQRHTLTFTDAKGQIILQEKDTVHIDVQEARMLGIQLLKLATEPARKDGVVINASDMVDNITVYQKINPDDTFANTACIEVNEDEEAEDYRTNNGISPNFSIEGEALEELIAVLAKIV